MDNELREMLDHYRITRLIGRYCRGCDRMDEALMASVYAEGSWDDHGLSKMPGPAFAKATAVRRASADDVVSHLLGQSLIRVDGDEAGAETYFLATIRRTDQGGKPVLDQLSGRYVDVLVRDGDGWKIKSRITLRDWSVTLEIGEDRLAERQFVAGRADRADSSFGVLEASHSVNRSG